MSRWPRIAAAIVVIAIAAACGSDEPAAAPETKKVSAQVWAKDVCETVRPWAGTIQTAVTNTQKTLSKSSQPKVVKPQLTQLFFGAANSTDTAIAGVTDAGVPDVDNGEKIAKDFRSALVSARDAFAAAQKSVQALDTKDKAKFDAAVSKVGTKLKQDYAKAGKNIEKATSQQLTQAFEKEPACK